MALDLLEIELLLAATVDGFSLGNGPQGELCRCLLTELRAARKALAELRSGRLSTISSAIVETALARCTDEEKRDG